MSVSSGESVSRLVRLAMRLLPGELESGRVVVSPRRPGPPRAHVPWVEGDGSFDEGGWRVMNPEPPPSDRLKHQVWVTELERARGGETDG